jgi:hypothetical protein
MRRRFSVLHAFGVGISVIAIASAAIMLAFYFGTGVASAKASVMPPVRWTPHVGDLVFRASDDRTSGGIRAISSWLRTGSMAPKATVSHVGIVVNGISGFMVAEASPFGSGKARLTPVSAFVAEPDTILVKVLRHVDSTRFDAADMSHVAASFSDRQLPFDWQMDMANDQELYCSELALQVLAANGVDELRYQSLLASYAHQGARLAPDTMSNWPEFRTVGIWEAPEHRAGSGWF